MEKPDAGSDFFSLVGMIMVFVFLFRREIAAEWRELRGKRDVWRISGPLKRLSNHRPLEDWTKKHEERPLRRFRQKGKAHASVRPSADRR